MAALRILLLTFTSRFVRPHQVDFLFHGPPVQKKLNFQKKKKNFFIKKRSARDQIALPQFPFIMLHIIVMESKVEFNDIHDLKIFGRPTDPYFWQQ